MGRSDRKESYLTPLKQPTSRANIWSVDDRYNKRLNAVEQAFGATEEHKDVHHLICRTLNANFQVLFNFQPHRLGKSNLCLFHDLGSPV